MNINKRKVKALIILSAIAIVASNLAAQGDLTGAWLLNIRNTTFGLSGQSLRTYHVGGTITETSSALPTLLESPAHGVWSRQGSDFVETFMVFEFDSTKQLAGWMQVRGTIRLIGSDSLSTTWNADFILPNGNVIPNVATGI